MPLYLYLCLSCQEEFEEIRPVSDKDKTILCPNCNSSKTQKQVSSCSFTLKGSKWAKDGYCKPKKVKLKRTVKDKLDAS